MAVDPRPLFDISPLLYMQFMEPLGSTDSSAEAAWDYRITPGEGGRAFEIAPRDLRQAVNQDQPGVFQPRESALPSGVTAEWLFPAGSVAAIELDLA